MDIRLNDIIFSAVDNVPLDSAEFIDGIGREHGTGYYMIKVRGNPLADGYKVMLCEVVKCGDKHYLCYVNERFNTHEQYRNFYIVGICRIGFGEN